jgi:hypothetical protein
MWLLGTTELCSTDGSDLSLSMFACLVVTQWFRWKQTRWQGLCWFSSLCFPCRDSQVLSFQNCQCATYWSHYWCSTKLWPYHLLITFLRGPRFADRWMILPPNIDGHLHKQCTLLHRCSLKLHSKHNEGKKPDEPKTWYFALSTEVYFQQGSSWQSRL